MVVWGHLTVSLVHGNGGGPLSAIGMVEDITDRKRIEQQYLQAQKMDAIGRLAGGVAHDFNNLLTVMLGSSELLLEEFGPHHPLRPIVIPIQEAATRAAALTRQLLTFSRQQVIQPDIVNLNTIVARVEALLRRLIGEDILLVAHLAEELGTVRADPSQLEQVLLNLAINARDAMTNGGTLIIETANVMLDLQLSPRSRRRQQRALCAAGDQRHRQWDGRGHAGAHLRAVLHHQAAGERDRPRASDRLWDRPAERRVYLGL